MDKNISLRPESITDCDRYGIVITKADGTQEYFEMYNKKSQELKEAEDEEQIIKDAREGQWATFNEQND